MAAEAMQSFSQVGARGFVANKGSTVYIVMF